jgi:dynein heavy chain
MAGALMIKSLKDDVLSIKTRASSLCDAVFVRLRDNLMADDERVRMLVRVRESIDRIGPMKAEMDLLLDRSDAVLSFLKERSTIIPGVDAMFSQGRDMWLRLLAESPRVLNELLPLMAANIGRIRSDIFAFQNHMDDIKCDIFSREFTQYTVGYDSAVASLEAAEKELSEQTAVLQTMLGIARVFDAENDTLGASNLITEITGFLHDYRLFWDCYAKHVKIVDTYRRALWSFNTSIFDSQIEALTFLIRRLPRLIKAAPIYPLLEKEINDFRLGSSLAKSLQSPSMRERHWLELMKIAQKKITLPDKDPSFTIGHLMELDLVRFVEPIEALLARSEIESRHDDALVKIQTTWNLVELLMTPFGEAQVPLLSLSPSDVQLLETDIIGVGLILRNRYDYFHKKAKEWQISLTLLSDLLRQIEATQRLWCFLQPLFESEEIRKNLVTDAKVFREIDSSIIFQLKRLWRSKVAMRITKEQGLIQKLRDMEVGFDSCKRSIDRFMEKKRALFPRFCFVCDKILLDILANATQPIKVLKNIQCIVQSTAAVKLDREVSVGDAKPNAVSFLAAEGSEVLIFSRPIALQGSLHEYLQAIVSGQEHSLRIKAEEQIHRYLQLSREIWVTEKNELGESRSPCQVILLVGACYFSHKVEHAFYSISLGETDAISKYSLLCKMQLSDLQVLARTRLSACDRIKVSNLILQDAHFLSIIEAFVENNIFSSTDFAWQSKLRIKFKSGSISSENKSISVGTEVVCAIFDSIFPYGFEYSGNGIRAAITPLTEKVYANIALAISLRRGVVLVGHEDVGKKETLKSMCIDTGKFFRLFNCGMLSDSSFLDRCIAGVACSGCWGIFSDLQSLSSDDMSVFTTGAGRMLEAQSSKTSVVHFFEGLTAEVVSASAILSTYARSRRSSADVILPPELKVYTVEVFNSVCLIMWY